MGFYHNRAYGFAPPAKRLLSSITPGGSLSAIAITAAIGYSSKQAMINAMVADPTTPWAYGLLAAASAGFQFNFIIQWRDRSSVQPHARLPCRRKRA